MNRAAAVGTNYGRVDPRAVVDLVRVHHVDVLSVQELTPQALTPQALTAQALTALDAAGLWALLPYRILRPEPRAAGTGLASRYPLHERASTQPSSYHWQPAALVELPGTAEVEVVAVHAVAPVSRPNGAPNSPACPRRCPGLPPGYSWATSTPPWTTSRCAICSRRGIGTGLTRWARVCEPPGPPTR